MTLNGGDYLQYFYDGAYQLTREERKNSGDTTQYYNQFLYDGVGNRSKLYYYDGQDTITRTSSYNSANQLTQDADGTTTNTYYYDDNGNLTRKNDGASNLDYFYDDTNRLTRYDAPGTDNDGTYLYDNTWRRVAFMLLRGPLLPLAPFPRRLPALPRMPDTGWSPLAYQAGPGTWRLPSSPSRSRKGHC